MKMLLAAEDFLQKDPLKNLAFPSHESSEKLFLIYSQFIDRLIDLIESGELSSSLSVDDEFRESYVLDIFSRSLDPLFENISNSDEFRSLVFDFGFFSGMYSVFIQGVALIFHYNRALFRDSWENDFVEKIEGMWNRRLKGLNPSYCPEKISIFCQVIYDLSLIAENLMEELTLTEDYTSSLVNQRYNAANEGLKFLEQELITSNAKKYLIGSDERLTDAYLLVLMKKWEDEINFSFVED